MEYQAFIMYTTRGEREPQEPKNTLEDAKVKEKVNSICYHTCLLESIMF